MEKFKEPKKEKRGPVRRFFALLGPGLVTGAADDDPSGIVTYSIAGAQLGTSMLWTALLTFPLMAAVQMMCARIGMVTQPLCAIVLRCQSLADKLPVANGPAKGEAMKLREMLGQTVEEVERISRDLRPSVLEHLGLVEVLRGTSTEFAQRTGVSLKLVCVELTTRLPADIELTLYRILQEALKNVEKHARAHRVTVRLTKPGNVVQLVIKDDGIGFAPDHHPARQKGKAGLGLLSMRERATYVGGVLRVKSARHVGTKIEIRLPLLPAIR